MGLLSFRAPLHVPNKCLESKLPLAIVHQYTGADLRPLRMRENAVFVAHSSSRVAYCHLAKM